LEDKILRPVHIRRSTRKENDVNGLHVTPGKILLRDSIKAVIAGQSGQVFLGDDLQVSQ
jgi:hypothetical protein